MHTKGVEIRQQLQCKAQLWQGQSFYQHGHTRESLSRIEMRGLYTVKLLASATGMVDNTAIDTIREPPSNLLQRRLPEVHCPSAIML